MRPLYELVWSIGSLGLQGQTFSRVPDLFNGKLDSSDLENVFVLDVVMLPVFSLFKTSHDQVSILLFLVEILCHTLVILVGKIGG